jgi:hypothetical protein
LFDNIFLGLEKKTQLQTGFIFVDRWLVADHVSGMLLKPSATRLSAQINDIFWRWPCANLYATKKAATQPPSPLISVASSPNARR